VAITRTMPNASSCFSASRSALEKLRSERSNVPSKSQTNSPHGGSPFLQSDGWILKTRQHGPRSGFKTSDQVQENTRKAQADRESRVSQHTWVCEHLSEACNAAIGPQMGF
jgi:hypothetical protein